MQTRNLDTKEAPVKWWAAADARQRNLNNASHYTDRDRARAERMKLALEIVYHANGFYISYGKRGKISIKVDHAEVVDKKTLRLLETDWTAQGVTKKVSAQGVIYNFTA